MTVDRRDFLKQAGVLLSLPALADTEKLATPAILSAAPDVVVVGGGNFGAWTALNLRRMGARVTLVDLFGPANSRSTSGDETRGVRSSYGNKESWVVWAKEAVKRWREWDEEYGKKGSNQLFFPTGDIILRAQEDGMIRETKASWDKFGYKYELLNQDELRARFPQFRMDTAAVGLYEPDAGVVRSRRAVQVVADVFKQQGGSIVISHASVGTVAGRRVADVTLDPGSPLKGDIFVFACGPWLGKVFPEVMGPRIRTPIGHVYYYATPPGDNRFTWPNCPSWNVPGVTGWPALGPDNRGFRVRTGGRPVSDPDYSVRWVDSRYHDNARNTLANWFPDLYKQPLLETRACHYESSPSRDFIIDTHPDYDNVWIAGCGNAESFKMGPVLGEYIANRVLGKETDKSLDENFKLPTDTYESQLPDPARARRMGITEVEELL